MSNLRLDRARKFRGNVAVPDSEWLFNQAKSQAGQELFVIAMTQGKVNGRWLEIGCGHPVSSNNTYLLEKRLGWSGISIDSERMDQTIITPFEEYWESFYYGMRDSTWPEYPVGFEEIPISAQLRYREYYDNFIARQRTDVDFIDPSDRSWSTVRPNAQFIQADAFDMDYSKFTGSFDYLQVDIHPSSANFELLNKILPFHRFSVITFEHDAWDHTQESQQCRVQSRDYLRSLGYELVISDATVPPGHGNGIGDEPINFEDWWVAPDIVPTDIIDLYRNLSDDGQPKYYFETLF